MFLAERTRLIAWFFYCFDAIGWLVSRKVIHLVETWKKFLVLVTIVGKTGEGIASGMEVMPSVVALLTCFTLLQFYFLMCWILLCLGK